MSPRRANQLIALGMLTGLALIAYLAFHPSLPFDRPFEVKAVVASSNQLRGGAPVRIAGVDVGKVASIDRGPGDTTTLTLDVEDSALPLHRDATLRIRPRVFLEGGFYVELAPGTPSAPQLRSGETLPLPQTTLPVQFHQLLSVFEQPIRESMKSGLSAFATGLSGGGAEGLRQVAPNLAPMLRDTAIAAQAARGTAPHDVSRLIAGAGRATAALARDRRALADLVTNVRVTGDALSAGDRALADSLAETDALLRSAPSGLRALDGVLPVLTRVARASGPAVHIAPAALTQTGRVLDELGSLVAPGVRERTVSGLRTTFLDLPTLVVRMSALFPTVKPLADCLRTHIIPTLNTVAPDGALSTGRPVWQDFAHSLVGLTSATQNFDGNGYWTRYLFGLGPTTVSTEALPGIGALSGQSNGPLQSRPLPPAGRQPPPINRTANCADQAMPSFETPAGSGR